MNFLGFVLGLLVGLLLLMWQQARLNRRIKRLLRELSSYAENSSLPSTSQLTLAIAQQQQVLRQFDRQIQVNRQILTAAPIGYLQVDDENRLIWCNPRARSLLGIQQEPSTPRLLLEVVRSYELDHLIEQARDQQQLRQQDWTFYPVSSEPTQLFRQEARVLRGYCIPLPEKQVGIFLENREEAITLMQQRDRWASDVAHELKTPLTSIRLVAETLQTRLDPPLRTWVDRLIRETMRLSTLVQDLLDLAHLDRNSTQSLQRRTVNLVELIQTAWLNLEPLARKKDLQLSYSGPLEFLMYLDEPRIYRVLINLLDNSIKYSPPGKAIQVQLGLESDSGNLAQQWVCLQVIDAGPGFAAASLPHVFERFYRADPARTRHSPTNNGISIPKVIDPAMGLGTEREEAMHQGGSGLGLAIVRQIVEAHQGSVSAQNYSETGGAWLQVRLPREVPTDRS